MANLSLEEVTSLLGVSEKSILNHIDKKRLNSSTIKSKGDTIHVFQFSNVKDFASEFLDITLSEPELEEVVEEKKSSKKGEKKGEESNILKSIISDLKEDYTGMVKQLTEYKEQAAFQIGQLKNQVENNQKMLTSGRKEAEERDLMIRKLKMKLKEKNDALEKEKTMLDNMNLFQRVFKIKK